MNGFQHLIGDIRRRVGEIDPRAAWRRMQAGAVLVDVREPPEWSTGRPAGSHGVPRSHVEFQIEQVAPDLDTELLLICAAGMRSLLVGDALQRMGYTRVASVAGGFSQWRTQGLPVVAEDALDADARERYDRHLRLPEIGTRGQRRLLDSRVLLVGAGGLGSPAALYLAAAGVGTLVLVDDDRVERSNLQRQVLHEEGSIGRTKVESAKRRLSALNPGVRLETVEARFDADNAATLLDGCDLLIDGADNLRTRYCINDACLRAGVPRAYGAVERFRGQASLFVPGQGPCYRCLFPDVPAADAPSCADTGVLGVLPGVIGLIQATEAIKWLLGLGEPLVGRLLGYDALSMRFSETRLVSDPDCPACGRV